MRIGIVSQWYAPENAGPTTLVESLAERGHDVKVLTGFPNYPTGTVFPGFRQRWGHIERQGRTPVRRVPLYPSHDAHPLRRAGNYLSFAAASTLAAGFLADRDVVYVYATPMTAASAAAVLHVLGSRPFVLHVQDLWPESVLESGMVVGGVARRAVRTGIDAGLRYLYRRAAHVIAIAPTMARLLVERGAAAENVSTVLNWSADESADDRADTVPDPAARARLGRADRTIAVFAGNVGQMQDVETIVRAAALCRTDTPIDVAVVGSGTARASVADLARDLGADNVRMVDPVPRSGMRSVYRSADYQLVTLKNRPVFRATIPSKLASALAAGCPIITTVPGDVTAMCDEGGFGLSAPPEDPEALAETFRRACREGPAAREKMSLAASEFYWGSMSMTASVSTIESILAGAAGRTGSGTEERRSAP